MSCTLSLHGVFFTFHSLPQSDCHELTALVLRYHGQLYDARKTTQSPPDVVYMITSFWMDCQPRAGLTNVSLRLVTRFWLQEMIRRRRWLRPESHVFFEPPRRRHDLWLEYPVDYQDAAQDRDDLEKNSHMQKQRLGSQLRPQVRLPCSPHFCFRGVVPLWPYLAAYLSQPIHDVEELTARLQLITLSHPRRSFNCLEYAVNELLTTEEQTKFFRHVLPEMTRIVLALPQMFATPPPLLIPQERSEQTNVDSCSSNNNSSETYCEATTGDARHEAQVVTQSHRFSKLEVLALVCGCFFGIFPDQDIVKTDLVSRIRKTGRHGNDPENNIIQFPHFTAVRMFSAPDHMAKMVVLKGQKICCLLQYFLCVVPLAVSKHNAFSAEVIDFTRVGVHLPDIREQIGTEESFERLLKVLDDSSRAHCASPSTADSHPRLYAARCVSNVLIEDMDKHLQIDFANKFAGGGVLSSGCVQEEIRFVLSPELLVSCLVFAKLEPHEAFVVHGTERYNTYQGYGGSFVYGGTYEDTTSWTSVANGCVRRECVIVGIDATDYGAAQVQRQYERGYVWRDLLKAYAGFAYPEASHGEYYWPVATGNWGCGVFQGECELKFLIQWLAASLCHRELVYVLFEHDLDLRTKVNTLLTLATSLKSREWDQQCSGLIQWLMRFLLNELDVDRETKGDRSVLTRALRSLKRALATFNVQVVDQEVTETNTQKQSELLETSAAVPHTNLVSSEINADSPSATFTRHEEQVDETMRKKPKTMKRDFHQRTMQDIHNMPK